MSVFIVLRCEPFESSTVAAVYSSVEAAKTGIQFMVAHEDDLDVFFKIAEHYVQNEG